MTFSTRVNWASVVFLLLSILIAAGAETETSLAARIDAITRLELKLEKKLAKLQETELALLKKSNAVQPCIQHQQQTLVTQSIAKESEHYRVVFGIPTKSRDGSPGYLTCAVGALVSAGVPQTDIFVFDISPAETHNDLKKVRQLYPVIQIIQRTPQEQSWSSQVINECITRPLPSESSKVSPLLTVCDGRSNEANGDDAKRKQWRSQESIDALFVLEKFNSMEQYQSADWFVFLQDDAVMQQNGFQLLQEEIRAHMDLQRHQKYTTPMMFSMWKSWKEWIKSAGRFDHLPNFEKHRHKAPPMRYPMTDQSKHVPCAGGGGHCGNVAIVYNRKAVQDFVQFLDPRNCVFARQPIDWLLEAFTASLRVPFLAFDAVRHIGWKSTHAANVDRGELATWIETQMCVP